MRGSRVAAVRRSILLVCFMSVGGLTFLPAPAGAAVSSQTIAGSASPSFHDYTAFGGASLRLDFDTAYPALPTTTTLSEAVIHLDDDFAFDTVGLAQCNPAALPGTTTAMALA